MGDDATLRDVVEAMRRRVDGASTHETGNRLDGP